MTLILLVVFTELMAGTKVEPIIEQLLKIPYSKRSKVREITLDMANSMKVIAKKCLDQMVFLGTG